MSKIELFNRDCMEAMAEMPDKAFDLAIVDPPYGIGMSGGNVGYKGHNDLLRKDWDNATPPPEYFSELRRVSASQIVWGGNYFDVLWPTRGYVVWDKGAGFRGRSYAESELAWTSFDCNARTFTRDPLARGDYHGKIHPTQKPVALYRWLLDNYAKPGDKILDTHGGSRSLAIACHDLGFDHVSYEIDPDYHRDSVQRFERHKSQQKLFTAEEIKTTEPVQLRLI